MPTGTAWLVCIQTMHLLVDMVVNDSDEDAADCVNDGVDDDHDDRCSLKSN